MTGTNAESFSAPSFMTPFSLARRSRLIHLCNRFAFTPCESARLAIDTPGCKHASTSRLFACGLNIRMPSPFTLIIWSPSHTHLSMSLGVHCQLGGHPYSASTLQCARCRKLSAYVVLVYFAGKWAFGMLRAIGKVGKAFSQLKTPRVPTGGPPTQTPSEAPKTGAPPAQTPSEAPNKAYRSGARAGRALRWLINRPYLFRWGSWLYALLHSKSLNEGEEEEIKRIHQQEQQWLQSRNPNGAASENEPRGIRNRNPGNIEYGPFARSHGALGSDGRFAQFCSAEQGLKALADLLQVYAKKGRDTIRRIIKRYAPSSENKTEAYIASVAKRLGVGADTPLDMRDSRVIAGLMNAIIRIENGKNPYSADRVSQIAQASTAGAPSAIALDERSQNPWDAVSPTFNRWVNTAKRASGGLTTLAETQNPWGTGLFDLHTAPFDFHRAAEAVVETKAAHPYRIESRARLPDAEPGRANATSDVSMNQTLNITVNGVSDPQEAADAIQHAQQNINAQLIRNLRGAVVI